MNKISIRPLLETDAASIALHANNIKIFNNLSDIFPNPYTIIDARNFILSSNENITQSIHFAIDRKGEAIGCISAYFKTNIHRYNAEIGYWIGEKYWGNGFGTSAVLQIVSYLFEITNINCIFAEVFSRNTGSQRVLEKAGFFHEATFEKFIYKNDKFEDSCMYTLLRDNYDSELSL